MTKTLEDTPKHTHPNTPPIQFSHQVDALLQNYSPLQLVGTKHHGFHTLVGHVCTNQCKEFERTIY